jgi:gluconolactonase
MERKVRVGTGVLLGAAVVALGVAVAVAVAQMPTPQEVATFVPPDIGRMRGDGPPPPSDVPFSITKLDPSLDELIAPGAKLEPLGDYFGLVEGPVWVPDQKGGYLLISDMLSNVIYKETADKTISVYLDKAGYSGDDINNAGIQTRRARAHVLLIGPECTSRDAQGRLIWCASNDGKVMRLEPDGTRTVVASGYEGKRFDGPNDLAITTDGAIYMTDVDTGLRYGNKSPLKQLPNQGVYRIKDGKVTLAVDEAALGGAPNGVAISPDDKYIYLNAGRRKIMRYDIKPDGSLANGVVFYVGPGIGDGMKTDLKGNLFSSSGAGPGEVAIIAPSGKKLGLLNIPISASEPKRQICALNFAWGEEGGKTLFIMGCEAVYKIRMKTAGRIPGPPAAANPLTQAAYTSKEFNDIKPNMRGDGPSLESRPFSITRTDPSLDELIAPDAKLESLGDRFGLTEGPVWIADGKSGYVVVADLIENVLFKITPDHKTSVFLDKAGYSGDDVMNAGSQTRRGRSYVLMIGANGTTLDAQGRLIWCAANDGTIVRLEKDGTTRTVLASGIDGKRFDGPNDIIVKRDGAMYMTDSDWGLRGRKESPLKQLPYAGVFLIKDGKVKLLLKDGELGGPQPNGVALSPDEKYLYLTAGSTLKRYDVLPDDTIGTQATVLAEAVGIGDGLKVDKKGNLWTTSGAAPGVVLILAPTGKILGSINLPVAGGEPKRQICATNDAFGDPDGKALYITACESVYKIRLRTTGIVPGPGTLR